MPGFIDIFLVGDDAGVQAMLLHLENKLSPPALGGFLATRVDPYLRARAGDRFANEGDDVVGRWAPLKQYTQNIRSQMGYGADHPINRRTGRLENYILGEPSSITVHAAGASMVYPGNPPQGEEYDKLRRAQFGSAQPPTVARPVLGVNERDLATVLTMMALEIQRP